MATTERLRADIDSGRTRDKVRHLEPAAAPLGADEEAAGTPVPRYAVEIARAQEVEGPVVRQPMGGVIAFVSIIALIAIALCIIAFLLVR
jgi:hypothetical protein